MKKDKQMQEKIREVMSYLGKKGGEANKGIPKPKSADNGRKGGRPKGKKKRESK